MTIRTFAVVLTLSATTTAQADRILPAAEMLPGWCLHLTASKAATLVVAARLGEITDKGSAVTPVKVRTYDGQMKDVALTSAPKSDQLAHLTASPRGRMTLKSLEGRFGQSRPIPKLHPDRPDRVVFPVFTRPRATHTCTVFADVEGGDVLSVILRRDKASK